MEPWLLLALAAYTSGAISNSIDKFVMKEHYQPYIVDAVKMLFDGLWVFLAAMLLFGIELPGMKQLLLILFLGVLYGCAGVFYFMALKESDASKILPYEQAAKILVIFFLSLLIFNETASIVNIIGICVAVIGVYLMISTGFKRISWDKGTTFITFTLIFNTAFWLLAKYMVGDVQPATLGFLMYFAATFVLFIFRMFHADIRNHAERTLEMQGLSHIAFSSFFGASCTLLLLLAISVGDASKVYPVSAITGVIILLFGIFFLKEKITWRRALGIGAVAVGVFLVAG